MVYGYRYTLGISLYILVGRRPPAVGLWMLGRGAVGRRADGHRCGPKLPAAAEAECSQTRACTRDQAHSCIRVHARACMHAHKCKRALACTLVHGCPRMHTRA